MAKTIHIAIGEKGNEYKDILGVFETREEAEKRIDRCVRDYTEFYLPEYELGRDYADKADRISDLNSIK